MDVLNLYGILAGVVLSVLSGGATFYNKQRFVAQNDLLRDGNDELRNQNKDLRDERTDLTAQLAAAKARDEERERLIENYKRQPNFTQLTKVLSNNHKEVMAAITAAMKDRDAR